MLAPKSENAACLNCQPIVFGIPELKTNFICGKKLDGMVGGWLLVGFGHDGLFECCAILYSSIKEDQSSNDRDLWAFNSGKDGLRRREGPEIARYAYPEIPFRWAPMQCEFQVRASNYMLCRYHALVLHVTKV